MFILRWWMEQGVASQGGSRWNTWPSCRLYEGNLLLTLHLYILCICICVIYELWIYECMNVWLYELNVCHYLPGTKLTSLQLAAGVRVQKRRNVWMYESMKVHKCVMCMYMYVHNYHNCLCIVSIMLVYYLCM